MDADELTSHSPFLSAQAAERAKRIEAAEHLWQQCREACQHYAAFDDTALEAVYREAFPYAKSTLSRSQRLCDLIARTLYPHVGDPRGVQFREAFARACYQGERHPEASHPGAPLEALLPARLGNYVGWECRRDYARRKADEAATQDLMQMTPAVFAGFPPAEKVRLAREFTQALLTMEWRALQNYYQERTGMRPVHIWRDRYNTRKALKRHQIIYALLVRSLVTETNAEPNKIGLALALHHSFYAALYDGARQPEVFPDDEARTLFSRIGHECGWLSRRAYALRKAAKEQEKSQ